MYFSSGIYLHQTQKNLKKIADEQMTVVSDVEALQHDAF